MRTEVKYIAEDGREFTTEAECVAYEKRLMRARKWEWATQYVEEHGVKADELIEYDQLDSSWWSGYIVEIDDKMAEAVAVLTGEAVPVLGQVSLLEVCQGDAYRIPSLKDFLDNIQKTIDAFKKLAK